MGVPVYFIVIVHAFDDEPVGYRIGQRRRGHLYSERDVVGVFRNQHVQRVVVCDRVGFAVACEDSL